MLAPNHVPHDVDLRPGDENEIGSGQGVSCGYFLAVTIDQEMAEPSGREEYARESESYGSVDHNATGVGENVETGVNQNDGDMNHQRCLTRISNLLHALGLANSYDLAAMDLDIETLSAALQSEPRTRTPTEPSESKDFFVKMRIESVLLEQGQNFQKDIVNYGENYYTVRCAIEGCSWCTCVVAGDNHTFTFNPVRQEHTCGLVDHPGYQQSSVQRVASSEEVEQPLRENPYYRPKEIFQEIHPVHGMPLSHEQASSHQEHYVASAPGSFEEDYSLLSQYCNQVRQTNPGSLASVDVNPMHTSSFRLFISYQASIFGFLNACRPLVWLDQTILRNKYPLNLLFATGFDGDGAFFPLAFAVVGQENDANWMWFLCVLQNLLNTQAECIPKLIILSDQRRSIQAAVKTNFPTAYDRLCMHLVSEIFQKSYHNSILVNHLWKAANAFDPWEFEIEVLNIAKINPDAARLVRRIPPVWANLHFKGLHYSYPAVRVVESLKAWIHEANGLFIVQVMECIHHKMMKLFNERREASMKWTSLLVPSAEKQVSEAIHCARSYVVPIGNYDEFLVISQEGKEVVNIRSRCCSCRRLQQYGLPCSHAAAVLLRCKQNVYSYTWDCFTVATYRKAYSQSIHPILPDIVVNPAKSLEQGRKRTQSSDPGPGKRVRRCSRCKYVGHTKRHCSLPE